MRLKDFVKETGGTMSDLFNLPLSVLRPNPENIRMDTQELRDHIRGIASSIKATGYLRSRPFTVRFVGDAAVIVDGNCRYAACQIAVSEGADIMTVPCLPEALGTNDADRCANMLVANSGLPHQPLELVAAIKKLMSFGWTDTRVAERLGKSRAYVANLLELGAAPEDVQVQIRNGTVSATSGSACDPNRGGERGGRYRQGGGNGAGERQDAGHGAGVQDARAGKNLRAGEASRWVSQYGARHAPRLGCRRGRAGV